jgi:hypothetical protein
MTAAAIKVRGFLIDALLELVDGTETERSGTSRVVGADAHLPT